MTVPRYKSMDPKEIETHHIWSRCVQRARLFGVDPVSQMDFGYRRDILQELIEYETINFGIDLGNYTILENHFHLIARSRPDIVKAWSDEEVIWHFKRARPRWKNGQWEVAPTDQEIRRLLADPESIAHARLVLSSISYYVGIIKESVAKLFNAEMETRGHFWEARFGNRRLESEEEVLTAFLYNDLNHVKAGAAPSLIESHRSAIQDRLLGEQARQAWIEEHSLASLEAVRNDLQNGSPNLSHEVLSKLFGDCWLAPIGTSGPLSTQEEHVSSLILPFDNCDPMDMDTDNIEKGNDEADQSLSDGSESAGNTTETSESGPEQNPAESTPAESQENPQSPSQTGQSAPNSGVRKRAHRTRMIHRRYMARLKRRSSDRCFLGIDWEVYLKTVQTLAEQIVKARSGKPPHKCSWRSTVSTWKQDVRDFSESFANVIGSLIGQTSSQSTVAVSPSTSSLALPPPSST